MMIQEVIALCVLSAGVGWVLRGFVDGMSL